MRGHGGRFEKNQKEDGISKSQFNEDQILTKDKRILTLLCHKSTSIPFPYISNNHAVLVLEGIDENNQYFAHFSHFSGPTISRTAKEKNIKAIQDARKYGFFFLWRNKGIIKPFKPVDPKKGLPWVHKVSFVVDQEKATKMVLAVNQEAGSPNEQHPDFFLLGNQSVINTRGIKTVRGAACALTSATVVTAAIMSVIFYSIPIDTGLKFMHFFLRISPQFISDFFEKELSDLKSKWDLLVWAHGYQGTPEQQVFDQQLKITLAEYSFVLMTAIFAVASGVLLAFYAGYKAYKNHKQSHNCCSWALEKLDMCGVDISFIKPRMGLITKTDEVIQEFQRKLMLPGTSVDEDENNNHQLSPSKTTS